MVMVEILVTYPTFREESTESCEILCAGVAAGEELEGGDTEDGLWTGWVRHVPADLPAQPQPQPRHEAVQAVTVQVSPQDSRDGLADVYFQHLQALPRSRRISVLPVVLTGEHGPSPTWRHSANNGEEYAEFYQI